MGAHELVDIVDSNDRVVRTGTLGVCLRRGLLHRAVAVLVFRSNGRLLLQQRSFHDSWHPGRWTLSCTGHVRAGESYGAAASRELREELGIGTRPHSVSKVHLPKIRSRGMIEWEVTKVFACISDAPVAVDRSELERAEAIGASRLRKMMKGSSLTPDAKLIIRGCLGLVQEDVRVGFSLKGLWRAPLQRRHSSLPYVR